jgi:hypothetical protein
MNGKQTAILDVTVAYWRQQRRRKLRKSHFPYPDEQSQQGAIGLDLLYKCVQ